MHWRGIIQQSLRELRDHTFHTKYITRSQNLVSFVIVKLSLVFYHTAMAKRDLARPLQLQEGQRDMMIEDLYHEHLRICIRL